MTNILFSTECNQRCPYCFMLGDVGQRSPFGPPFMDIGAFRECLNFLQSSPSPKLHVGGGEPTLNPNFVEMSEMAIEAGFSLFLFTNGLIRDPVLDYIVRRRESFSFLINLNGRDSYVDGGWERVLRSIGLLTEASDVYLGINLWHEAFDLSDHARVAEEYQLQGLRVGLSNPSVIKPNSVMRSQLRENSQQFGQMLISLRQVAQHQEIPLSVDCGLTPCFFDPGFVRELDIPEMSSGEINWGCPGSAPVIGTDLMVRHCFMTVGEWRPLASYRDHDEMLSGVATEVERLKNLYESQGNCRTCTMGKTCGGTCLMGRINESTSVDDHSDNDLDFVVLRDAVEAD